MKKGEEESKDAELRVYEVGFQLLPTVLEERLPEETGKVRDAVSAAGGFIFSEEDPKFMRLAYPMEKSVTEGRRSWFENAYFGWMKFEAEPKTVALLKEALDKNPNILRFLTIKTVRENTLYRKTISTPGKKFAEKSETKLSAEPLNEAELDKTIEELVIN